MSLTSLKNKNVLKELEKTISPVLVINNSTLKPFVELFNYAPENIYQQPLGSLVGFFEIKDYNEESAYVVNFLTSVLKKEYYINPKRPVTESLDSALHKVNMALSELAKHGNVEWLGKIHAAICVLEKNNAHFSVSGNAKIFLFRNGGLSEISADLASDALDPHPLKTFINVSSGRMEKNDRLLITSEDIFHILPLAEIKKNFQRFESDKFVQFLKTALSNQMEMIASMVVEMSETTKKEAPEAIPESEIIETLNAFSGKTFSDSSIKDNLSKDDLEIVEDESKDSEYTDKKTGHIYVQGETIEQVEKSNINVKTSLYWDIFKEKISHSSYVTKNELRKRFSQYKKQLAKKRKLRQIEKERKQALEIEEEKLRQEQLAIEQEQLEKQLLKEQELEKIRLEQEEIRQIEIAKLEETERAAQAAKEAQLQKLENIRLAAEKKEAEKNFKAAQKQPAYEQTIAIKTTIKNSGLADIKQAKKDSPENSRKINEMSFLEKLRIAQAEKQETPKETLSKVDYSIENELEDSTPDQDTQKTTSKKDVLKLIAAKTQKTILIISKKAFCFFKIQVVKLNAKVKSTKIDKAQLSDSVTPHFSRIGKLYHRLNHQQKISSIVALILIFIVPIFIAKSLNRPKQIVEIPKEVAPPTQAQLLANEKNINTSSSVKTIYSDSNIITSIITNDGPILISKSNVVVFQSNQPKEFPIPAEFGMPIRASFMNDLSLVFVLTDKNKVLSFSPVSTKFTENKINLADASSENFIGTYLTYLYILDQKSNQIYRYPRAEGGFGDKTSWLKDGTNLANVQDMTIDDNIFAIQNNQILKFFKGQKQPLSLEASRTPIEYSKVYTTPDLQAIYALDTKNSRVVQFSKDGTIIAQYYNEALRNGLSLSVDEKNKAAYISTSSQLISLSIQ